MWSRLKAILPKQNFLDDYLLDMPATRESLLITINELEKKIIEENNRGGDATLLLQQLHEVRAAFAAKAVSLNEGTNLLKG